MRNISLLSTILSVLAFSAAASAQAQKPLPCVVPNGEVSVAVVDKDFGGAYCIPASMAQLVGGTINYSRMDVCKSADENIAAPIDKVPFTAQGSTFCMDRQTAEELTHLQIYKEN